MKKYYDIKKGQVKLNNFEPDRKDQENYIVIYDTDRPLQENIILLNNYFNEVLKEYEQDYKEVDLFFSNYWNDYKYEIISFIYMHRKDLNRIGFHMYKLNNFDCFDNVYITRSGGIYPFNYEYEYM